MRMSEQNGYTIVRCLQFNVEASDGQRTLRLKLAKDTGEPDAVLAEFTGVAGLSLKEFGGGLTQLL